MAFVFRTRLVQYGDLVNGEQVEITPVVAFTSAVGTVVETVPEAMALVPVQQRPAEADYWKYRVEWRVQSNVVPDIKGVVSGTGRLVFDVDFWDTEAARLAAPTVPQRRNTFIHEFTTKRLAGSATEISAAIDDYLLRAHFGNYPIDGRATIAGVTTATDAASDPLGLNSRGAITSRDGVPDDRPARWRSVEG